MINKTRTRGLRAAKIAALGAMAMSLSGCIVAMPPALQVASFALDGVSYVATGKSITDHAISTVTAQDCATMRALQGENICTAPEAEIAMLPDGTPAPNALDESRNVLAAADDADFQAYAAHGNDGDGDADEVLNMSADEIDRIDWAVASGPMM